MEESCIKAGLIDPLKPCAMSGALRGVYAIKEAIPIVHGASGCTLLYWLLFNTEESSRFQSEVRVLSTRLEERDIVYGAKDKLREALIKADRQFRPKLIVVISACAASITGEDNEAVISSLKGKINAQVISVDAGGYSGDALEGHYRLMKVLVDELMEEPKEKIPESVNLVGITFDDYNWREDVAELKRILNLLGIRVIGILSIADSIQELRNAPMAEMNVVLSDENGFKIAKYMKGKFRIPYICHDQPLPYGVESTNQWVTQIASAFNKEKLAQEVMAKECKEAYGKLVWKMAGYNQQRWFTELPVGIFMDATRAIGITKYISGELLMEPVLISLRSMGPNSKSFLNRVLEEEGLKPRILERPDLNEQAEAIKASAIDMAFGSTLEMAICQRAGIKSFIGISTPIYHKAYVDERPFMGYRGSTALYEEILNERLRLYFSGVPYGHVWDLSRYANMREGFNWREAF